MAWPGTLNAEQQQIMQQFDIAQRHAIMDLVKVLNACDSVYEWYWRQIGGGDTLIAKLDDADVIPSIAGLAGSQAITKSELTSNQMAYVEAALQLNTAAHRDHYRLAIGGPNMG